MSLTNGNVQTGNRPNCWSRVDVYDSENRECRGCGFQESCRSQVMKTINSNQQPAVQNVSNVPSYQQPSYYAPFQQQTQYAVPQALTQMYQPPAVQAKQFVPTTNYAVPAPFVAPTRIGPPQQLQPPVQQPQQQISAPADWYGRIQDPLFFQVLGPPPFRAQMQGETFGERLAKNMLLDLGMMAFFHLGLAVRQMFLPPTPEQSRPQTKDVTPR